MEGDGREAGGACHDERTVTSERQAEDVWKSMLHYESLQRYYTFVSMRLATRRRRLAQTVLTASSGAAAALLAGVPMMVAQVLALVVAALTVWMELADYSGKSARSRDLAAELGHLSREMRALWYRLDELDGAAAEQAWRELDSRATEVTRHVPSELFGYRALQDRAEDETYQYWAGSASVAAADA